MQLVAYGAQDIYLTGNPQITFFKVVYRRHTNFSMEAIEQTWDGTSTASGRCTATISRNGDLVHRMYLEIFGTTKATVNNPMSAIITDVELEIGGQKIDKQSGLWMEVWCELTETTDGRVLPGGVSLFQKMSGMGGFCGLGALPDQRFFVPLQFWFCRNPGLALPLIALQYHEVKVILNHNISSPHYGLDTSPKNENKLFCDYIYLDTDERRRFAQVSHEYLIEQVQEQSIETGPGSKDLNFNHPVKELIWTGSDSTTLQGGGKTLLPVGEHNGDTYQIKLNGHDRFAARDYRYFTRTQVWQHHSGTGGLDSHLDEGGAGGAAAAFNNSIAVYSFALKPEEHQPSGTCNFSRIDNAQLVVSGSSSSALTVFAVNYNVLRIMSGMGGLAYSN